MPHARAQQEVMPTILITGGAGFIGLNITEHLLGRGINVVCYSLAAPPQPFIRAVEGLPGHLSIVEGDVCDPVALKVALQQFKVGALIHGAAITADIHRERTDPARIFAVNLGGTLNVLEAAVQCALAQVIVLGSGAVFGAASPTDEFLDETRHIPVPDSHYGISKYAAERLSVRYRSTRQLCTSVVRLGTCFGRWEYATGVRDTLSIPLGLTQMAETGGHAVLGRQLPVDWVYADDVAIGVAKMLATTPKEPVYHLSAGQRWDALDWCKLLAEAFPGFTYEISDDPEKINIGRSTPTPRPPFAIGRMETEFGFRPAFTGRAAFEHYIRWRERCAI
jgi:nucleoside-diphosphate-sugar epimerase